MLEGYLASGGDVGAYGTRFAGEFLSIVLGSEESGAPYVGIVISTHLPVLMSKDYLFSVLIIGPFVMSKDYLASALGSAYVKAVRIASAGLASVGFVRVA